MRHRSYMKLAAGIFTRYKEASSVQPRVMATSGRVDW